jgi:superfamily II DNA or RNA helicase
MSTFSPGMLVNLRNRDWVVLPSDSADLLVVKPLGGADEETTAIYLPLGFEEDQPTTAEFPLPSSEDIGDISTARMLHNAARLSFRSGAGPFRSLAKLSFRPRSYQIVPLIMALRQEVVRLLISDDVGVGKTIEALLIIQELLLRRRIERFAVVCLPHLCEQWQEEIKNKLELDAVIIRSNTQARLDREIQGDTSVFDYYPFQVISVDYIKSEARRDIFIQQCPEMVIVDEAHSCAKPAGAAPSQQLRHHLLHRIAQRPNQHLVMLTATPHSGKSEEFHSLLGLLRPEFETLDLPNSSQAQRKELARHFIQRKRADVEKWLGEDTPFPKRDPKEFGYDLSPGYALFFEKILSFARKLVAGNGAPTGRKRVQYWTALGLLRGVMSSPAAGIEMLESRLGEAQSTKPEPVESEENPVHDTEPGFESDFTPTQVVEKADWSDSQKRQLRELSQNLQALGNPKDDLKITAARQIVEDLLKEKLNPIIFCRYIATAKYVGEQLAPLLRAKFPKLDIQIITSEDPDDVRRQRIDDMEKNSQRLLVATDCLSEGINLQKWFAGVIHYDLPWNPNRLEQREGRVDRFNGPPLVKTCLLYGKDNPIDGIVLDVILRKIREIRRSIGITIPFPEDSKSVIDAIAQALLMNPDRKIRVTGPIAHPEFDFEEFDEAKEAKLKISNKLAEAEKREVASRSIFAQHAINAQEIEADLKEVDESIGDPKAVCDFVLAALEIVGAQIVADKKGFRLHTANLPPVLKSLLPAESTLAISFESPTPEGYLYFGRNHPFVEQLCQIILANSVSRHSPRAARSAVIRTDQVSTKTTVLLFRCRNVIAERKGTNKIIAEEMLVWGFRGTPSQKDFLSSTEAKALVDAARATANLTPEARTSFLENELGQLPTLRGEFDMVAEERSKQLVEAHERFSQFMDQKQFQVVYPVLPMDVLGIYVLLPDGVGKGAK